MISSEIRRIALVVGVGALVVAVAAVLFLRSGLSFWGEEGEKLSVEEATQKYLDQAPQRAEPVASAQGVIYALNTEKYEQYQGTGTLEISALDADESSTHVRFSLSAESEHQLSTGRYTEGGDTGFRTAVLTAPEAGLTLRGAQWTGADGGPWDCTCARLPKTVGPAGIELSLLFPALPEDVSEVQLSIPGFAPLTAPVNRK